MISNVLAEKLSVNLKKSTFKNGGEGIRVFSEG